MNKLDQKLKELKEQKKLGIMTHVVIGYPSLEKTVEIVQLMEKEGVSVVELQIPFSDPLADGPVIMKACEKSLENGTTVKDAFAVMQKVSRSVSIPLLFMGYYNTVFNYGVSAFCRDAKRSGASGLIIPDMPIEEENREHFFTACKENNLHTIQVIAPVSTDERLRKNAKIANGFVYCSARQGTTGVRQELDPHLADYLTHVRKFFSCPLAVGFGISKKEHIQAIKPYADIAVIGSAVIKIIDEAKTESEMKRNISLFLREVMV